MTATDMEWDAFVASHPQGELSQSNGWAAAKRAAGWKTLRVEIAEGGELAGGAMVHAKRLAPGVWAGSVLRGPLVRTPDAALFARVVEAVGRAARHQGIRLIAFEPPAYDEPEGRQLRQALTGAGFRFKAPRSLPAATVLIDLQRTDADLLAGMTDMRRRNVKKALRGDVDVIRSDDVGTFHGLHCLSAQRQGFEPIPKPHLDAQFQALRPLDSVAIFLAIRDGRPVAGIWTTAFGAFATYKLPGWDSSSEVRNANELLHWHAMQWARTRGCRVYDLGGLDAAIAASVKQGQPLSPEVRMTPAYFKLGFGGTIVEFPEPVMGYTTRTQNLLLGGITDRWARSSFASQALDRLRRR